MPELTRLERLARREARRREIRRRRHRALALVIGVPVAVVVAVVGIGSLGGSDAEPGGSADSHADWRPHTGPVPILEYHVLGQPTPGAPYPELFVGRTEFADEMDWLDDNGFEAVTLADVQKAWYDKGKLPPRPVVISFDDGYRPQYTFALPELRKHAWPGVLNLKAEGSDLYTSNVEAMVRAGWELASHTISHPDLTTLDTATLRREVAGSRKLLQDTYGVPVDNFCYPAGRFSDRVIAAVRAAGYRGATTEVRGFASRDKPFELDRFEVLGSSGVVGIASFLRTKS